ncbi:MAG: glycosyltransferase [Bacteroidales bacterium]|nr:glycosyltransferase [Bacteroidales bacterium]
MSGNVEAPVSESFRSAPLLTVIVPVYNAEHWLPGLFETLRSQSFSDFKVLMVDDGSTDGGPAMMEGFCRDDRRFHLLRRDNAGQAAARNLALDALDTPRVTFLDVDDLLHPDAFRIWMEEALRLGPGSVVKGSWIEASEPSGRFFRPVARARWRRLEPDEAIGHYLYQSLPLTPVWGGVYDSDLFREIRFREGMFYEDLEIGPRILARAAAVAFTPERLYFYRQHPGSFMHTFSERRLDALRASDLIRDFIADNYPSLAEAAADRRWSANFNIFLLLARQKNLTVSQREIMGRCRGVILTERRAELSNSKVRIKNRIAALLAPILVKFF